MTLVSSFFLILFLVFCTQIFEIELLLPEELHRITHTYLKKLSRRLLSLVLQVHQMNLLFCVSVKVDIEVDRQFSSSIDLNCGATSSTTVWPHGHTHFLLESRLEIDSIP